uniref:Uncharacterized protein n=1 Tax=Clastoptera arizonana TaxID=38151 RepID=A0A1B6DZB7_9HEMI
MYPLFAPNVDPSSFHFIRFIFEIVRTSIRLIAHKTNLKLAIQDSNGKMFVNRIEALDGPMISKYDAEKIINEESDINTEAERLLNKNVQETSNIKDGLVPENLLMTVQTGSVYDWLYKPFKRRNQDYEIYEFKENEIEDLISKQLLTNVEKASNNNWLYSVHCDHQQIKSIFIKKDY